LELSSLDTSPVIACYFVRTEAAMALEGAEEKEDAH
jgi:hypothetical protein